MTHSRRNALAVLLGSATLASVSWASKPHSGVFRNSELQAGQKRSCSIATLPKQLPEAGALLDLEGLRRAIAIDSTAIDPEAEIIFSIRFAADGQREWLERIHAEGGARLPSRVQRLAIDLLRPQARSREPWNVRLHITTGDSTTFRVRRSEVCRAQRIVEGGLRRVGGIATGEEFAEMRRAREGRFAVEVSSTGAVVRVALLQSTGSRVFDDEMMQSLRATRYHPELVDGIAVEARFEISSSVRMR